MLVCACVFQPDNLNLRVFLQVRTRLERAYVDELMEEVDAAQQAQQVRVSTCCKLTG